MAGEIQLNSVTLATESGGSISLSGDVDTLTPTKTALNASGSAPIYACRAWVNFRGASQSGTATASGLVSGQYTATVTSASQFTVDYSGTTYTINTSGDHEIGDGEGVDLTVSGTTVTIDTQIRASGNVSSITDNGTGYYTVNFTTAMPDANYSASITAADNDGSGGTDGYGYSCIIKGYTSLSPSTLSFAVGYPANTLTHDNDYIMVAVHK